MSHTKDLQIQPITVAITATFTAEPLEQSLAFWMSELGMPVRIEFAPYNQIFQQLLDPSSLVATNQHGINVILVRLEDWQGTEDETPKAKPQIDARDQLAQNVRDFTDALRRAVEQIPTYYVICFCPISPSQAAEPERSALFKQMEERCVAELTEVHGIHIITSEQLAVTYPVAAYYDPQADKLAHIPFTPIFFTALATMIARQIYALKNTPYKVIVLDCDQTLWSGVCGEDGPLGIRIDRTHEVLQQCMVQQHKTGMLLCLCSKNNEEDVAAVFTYHPDMPLRREHIVAWRINWKPKSENLKALAAELQLGLESCIFIDDDPVECAEVRAHCPQVLTFQLPPDPEAIPRFLRHVWAFDHLHVTAESRKRTALYQQNVQREQCRKESLTFTGFLAGLGLQTEIAPLSRSLLARVSELTRRTNQFNLTTIRRSEAELHRLCQSGAMEGLVVCVKDRFGDYGLVGVILFMAHTDALTVDTFLLSCRAMGRGVEHKMLAKLGEIAQERGLRCIALSLVPTQKNRPAQDFLEHLGAEYKEASGNSFLFRFPAEFAANLQHSLPATEGNSTQLSEQIVFTTPYKDATPSTHVNVTLLSLIATELYEAEEIHKAVVTQTRRRPQTRTTFMAPQTPLEKKVAVVWSELLGFEQIGRDDDFFELGGHSLLAMQVLARLRESFQVALSPTILFTSDFTVAELARAISQEQIRQADPQNITMLLKKLGTLSDEEVQALLTDANRPIGR